MAVATGSKAASTPMKMIPPAMPKMPEINVVTRTVTRMIRALVRLMPRGVAQFVPPGQMALRT